MNNRYFLDSSSHQEISIEHLLCLSHCVSQWTYVVNEIQLSLLPRNFGYNHLWTEIWSQVVQFCKQVPSLTNYMVWGKLLTLFEQ